MVTVPDANDNSARPLAVYQEYSTTKQRHQNTEKARGPIADLKLQDDGENELERQVMNVAFNAVQASVPSIRSSNRSSGPAFARNRPSPPVLKTLSESSFADESFKLEETLIDSISVHSNVNFGMNQRSSIKIAPREPPR